MDDHLTTLSATVLAEITNKHEHFVGNVLSQSKENMLKTSRGGEHTRQRQLITTRDYVVDLAGLSVSNEQALNKRTESRKALAVASSTRKNHIYDSSDSDSDSSDSDNAGDLGLVRLHSRDCERPTSRVGSYLPSANDKPGSFFLDDSDSDSESEDDKDDDWEPSKIKYTGGAELTPCFSRASKDAHAFSDDEEDSDKPVSKKPSFTQICWDSRSSDTSANEDDEWLKDEEADDCDARSESEIWPDEMDSEDFPQLHTWAHSWIWRPSVSQPTSSILPLPSIHFHFVESLPPDQTCWTPLQDSMFNNLLTVPGHHAYNVAHPPMILETLVVDEDIKPLPYAVDPATPYEYSSNLGSCVTLIPTLAEQESLAIFSTPMKKRRRARPKTEEVETPVPVPEVVEVVEDRCSRGRSMHRSPRKTRSTSVLSSLEPLSEASDENDDDEFVYCGISGRAVP